MVLMSMSHMAWLEVVKSYGLNWLNGAWLNEVKAITIAQAAVL